MKVSYNWLKELINLEGIAPEELADKLTFAGVEVEEIAHLASGTNLVIGEIIACENHPDSDHLHILKVDEGKEYGVHQIVCGAPNARKGLKVIVARTGAVLPEVTIKPSTIRGVDSDGMCCSLLELGVDKKYLSEKQIAGIEELPGDAPVGETDVLGYLGLDDTILDISILPNRSDLYAMENVALEAASLTKRELKKVTYKAKKEIDAKIEVSSKSDKCPMFSAAYAKGIKVKPSPRWLSSILVSMGVRSINNVVDIGNYVMLLTGQPINMYDADKMGVDELHVVDDYEGSFLAMDDKEYALKKGDLLVMAGDKPGCLAGIMTSKECAVDENTKNVIIESAIFNGAAIRHTSNRIGLGSESSSRFVKGLSHEIQLKALEYCSALLEELADAKTSKASVYDTLKHETKAIKTSLSYINGRLGTSFGIEEVTSVLKDDHLGIEMLEGDEFIVNVPHYRIDMGGECDVSEEVIRLLGYDKIVSKLPSGELKYQGLNEEQANVLALRKYLRGVGVSEVITYTLNDEKERDSFRFLVKAEPYKVMNPLTEDHSYVRTSLIPTLLEAVSYNVAHQANDLAFFEVSPIDAIGVEERHLAIAATGKESFIGKTEVRPYDYFSMKGYLDGMMELLGLGENRYRIERLPETGEELHPGRSAGIYVGKTLVGILGELHPYALKKWGVGKNCAVMELNLTAILSMKVSPVKAIAVGKFPSVSRDLALVIDKGVSYQSIKKEIMKSDKIIKGVEVFDVFEGGSLPEGKKSVAVSIAMNGEDRTLVENEVALAMEKAIASVKMNLNAEVRG